MSADLYAAFIAEETPPKPEETSNVKACATTPAHRVTTTNIQSPTVVTRAAQANQQQKVPSPLWRRGTAGSDVLFDAEQADSGDEFGDFETAGDYANNVSNTRQDNSFGDEPLISTETASLALLDAGSADAIDVLHKPSHPEIKTPRTLDVQHTQSRPKSTDTSGQPSWDDEWGDFEKTETQPLPPSVAEETAQRSDDEWEPVEDSVLASMQHAAHPEPPASIKGTAAEVASPSGVETLAFERPNNVPPPSSLLQLLSSVFEFVHQSNVDSVLSKPELASQVLLVYRVASRIVAGRTLRWKRDTVLAQSVRIGQSGKSGGMKLAAVNKSETTKEERDTEEMVRDWSSYLHEFNSILTQAQVSPFRMRLSSTPPIKTLKQTNPPDLSKQCALCGLKRTERLMDVDVDADDIFGEFWVAHWGHKDCFDFWYSYKNLLGHR
ncbi:uncharacterized protein Z520_03771 [Fonsecaea multimorphosa CBS 102226]|uniref:PARP-type domain-containing protein n=1 Tax=Fonsecaea multimorphosa CBS 102226 TaxID=1442371 RepID=A0A0D2HDW1_9EURO|nr:uncharacterized protein Z520_03771 [Fonsecaea multimorphosa CBS 102226]KIY00086.1 hypothetical protein Z520_03771 [Fonsecaea multimorphosa CBS 102226]OAL27283.1 hypothetical protein AYO22_03558 [Fonsecaea multimorphosa]